MEMFVLELGLSNQPFEVPYEPNKDLVTHSWIKTLWEKISLFGVKVELGNLDIPFPKRGDKWLLREFLQVGYSGVELVRLNRVRIYMHVLFLLDVLCVQGKILDRKYLAPRDPAEK